MKKIVNWTFGSVFRTFGRVIAYILLGLLASVFISKMGIKIPSLGIFYRVNASTTIGSNSGWSSIDCTCPASGQCNTCTGSVSTGKIAFGTSSNTSGQGLTYKTNNLFYSTYNANYTYTISFRTHFGGLGNNLNLIKEQVSKNNWSFWIAGYNNDNVGFSDSYITSASCSTKFDNTTSNGFITTCNVGVNSNLSRLRIEVNFFNNNSSSVLYYSDIYNPTSMRVDFIDIIETQGVDATINNSTNNIINNQNQNSQNIINNQNQNTQQIIDSQNNLLGTDCQNLLDLTDGTYTSNGITAVVSKGEITLNGTPTSGTSFLKIPLKTTKTIQGNIIYSIGGYNDFALGDNLNSQWAGIRVVYSNNTTGTSVSFYQKNNSRTFTSSSTLDITNLEIRTASGLTYNNSHIKPVVNVGSIRPWCLFGTKLSKLDDVNEGLGHISGGIHDLQDSINDDNVSDSDIEDKLNYNVSNASQGPFATFLTLPLNWVQSLLNSNVCSQLHVPLPFLDNKYLALPCMDGFWESLGGLEYIITLCWYAVIGVRIFNGLFLLVVETTSAHDNDDYLTKIKSWEL